MTGSQDIMNNEEAWAHFFCAILNGIIVRHGTTDKDLSIKQAASAADLALDLFKSEKKKRFFEDEKS